MDNSIHISKYVKDSLLIDWFAFLTSQLSKIESVVIFRMVTVLTNKEPATPVEEKVLKCYVYSLYCLHAKHGKIYRHVIMS